MQTRLNAATPQPQYAAQVQHAASKHAHESLHTIRKHAPSPRTLATTKNRSSFSFVPTALGRALAASDCSIISAIAKHSITAVVRYNLDRDARFVVFTVFGSAKNRKVVLDGRGTLHVGISGWDVLAWSEWQKAFLYTYDILSPQVCSCRKGMGG